MLVEVRFFVEGGKPENPEKNPRNQARTNDNLDPLMRPARSRIRTRTSLVRGEGSNHCAISAPHTCIERYPVTSLAGDRLTERCPLNWFYRKHGKKNLDFAETRARVRFKQGV